MGNAVRRMSIVLQQTLASAVWQALNDPLDIVRVLAPQPIGLLDRHYSAARCQMVVFLTHVGSTTTVACRAPAIRILLVIVSVDVHRSATTAELLQAHLPTSKVVKAFNHIYAAELTTHGQPAGSKNRRALVIAGDDADAKAVVTKLLDEFGFDTVDAGPLKEGWRIQRDTPGYGPRRTAEELRKDLAAANRYADR